MIEVPVRWENMADEGIWQKLYKNFVYFNFDEEDDLNLFLRQIKIHSGS